LAEEAVPEGNYAPEDLQIKYLLFRENVTKPMMNRLATYMIS
jgi:hypothetical protein